MRIGQNPSKEQPVPERDHFHQVILPVYIPELEGYYEKSFEVLELCLNSLFKTCHSLTFITVVNNGSCKEVKDYLDKLFENRQIHELIHTTNIGKLNAILKGLCGHRFSLVTIADADTLFLTGWQNASYQIFETFPKAGVVGLTPQFRMYLIHSANLLFEKFFSKELKFSEVKDPQALQKFYKSIGWDDNYNQNYLEQSLTLETGGVSALVGLGHYVATYKGSLFQSLPSFLNAKLGRNTEQYLDNIPLKFGLWRLTTTNNFAYHMGNTPQEWMKTQLEVLKPEHVNLKCHSVNEELQPVSILKYFIHHKLFFKAFKLPIVYRWFLKRKGLPREMINNY